MATTKQAPEAGKVERIIRALEVIAACAYERAVLAREGARHGAGGPHGRPETSAEARRAAAASDRSAALMSSASEDGRDG